MTHRPTLSETPKTVTIEIPITRDADGFGDWTADALFTALDHASAYHGHAGSYSELYRQIDTELFEQIREQLNDHDTDAR